jgi:hypothetical protein
MSPLSVVVSGTTPRCTVTRSVAGRRSPRVAGLTSGDGRRGRGWRKAQVEGAVPDHPDTFEGSLTPEDVPDSSSTAWPPGDGGRLEHLRVDEHLCSTGFEGHHLALQRDAAAIEVGWPGQNETGHDVEGALMSGGQHYRGGAASAVPGQSRYSDAAGTRPTSTLAICTHPVGYWSREYSAAT